MNDLDDAVRLLRAAIGDGNRDSLFDIGAESERCADQRERAAVRAQGRAREDEILEFLERVEPATVQGCPETSPKP